MVPNNFNSIKFGTVNLFNVGNFPRITECIRITIPIRTGTITKTDIGINGFARPDIFDKVVVIISIYWCDVAEISRIHFFKPYIGTCKSRRQAVGRAWAGAIHEARDRMGLRNSSLRVEVLIEIPDRSNLSLYLCLLK